MNELTSAFYLQEYSKLFDRASLTEDMNELVYHDEKYIGFASPLHLGRDDMRKDILFIGINPSYRENDVNRYPLVNSTVGGREDYFAFEFDMHKYKAASESGADVYFGKIAEIIKQSGIDSKNCGYLDIFVHRKTEQSSIRKILDSPAGVEFIASQLEIFHDIITNLVKPKLIVVLNAQAQGFLGLRSYQKKGSVEKENVWLGLETSPTKIPMIYSITGLNPMLSPSFNARISTSLIQDEMHILPFKYLRYISKNEINDLIAALKEFKNNYLS